MKTESIGNLEENITKNKGKCVIYVRVSSDIQDYERQIVDLTQIAEEKKLTIPIDGVFEDKLSGYKDEYNREGIKNLMEYCIKNGITKVLIWELSRLARKHLVLLRLVEFFKNNTINVYFKKQGLWLLNETGEIDDPVGMMISVMGWYGEYETKLIKERFISQKKLNESLGKYNGGKIKFGYMLDENNKYVINDIPIKGLDVSEADIVREMFDLYEEGLTCSKICRIARSKGYPKIVCNSHTLARVLRETSYIGYKDVKLGRRPTPPIISKTQYNIVRDLIDTNKTKADKGRKHIYLLRGVLKCKVCGNYYVGKQTDDTYICPLNSGSNVVNKGSHCKGENISISNLDGIIWDCAKRWLKNNRVDNVESIVMGDENDISELEIQKERYIDLIKKIEQSRKKANIIFQNDGYTIKEYEKVMREIKRERQKCEDEIDQIDSKIRYHEKINSQVNRLAKRLESIGSITDRKQIQTIIRSVIKEVVFYRIGFTRTYLFVTYFNGYSESFIFNSAAKKNNLYVRLNFDKILYDPEKLVFYSLMDKEKTFFQAKTKILKMLEMETNLPDVISMRDFIRLLNKHNLNPKLSQYILPNPDEENLVTLDFDDLMKTEDIPAILKSYEYNKITYFKDLKISRFNRKKRKKAELNIGN